ncbi:tetratricopeptide repeat protein [Archangium sp.]|uniref:tetratricopeptide repeat protein n=1 Tax=Archangium sp. TaxID=1872627 RepID=UPI00389B0685
MTELEPLLNRIEQLTPYFGRAQDDLVALVTRGRNRDYKGVLQNARLVLEMLLRSLLTTELKQTPGKATLDELINKFRQQAHAGLIPTHVLAHMGTVQAWGNLSAHDHAGDLQDAGVKVDLQEAMTSLNSLGVILTWYRERHLQEPAITPVPGSSMMAAPPVKAPVGTPSKPVPAVRPPGGKRLAWVGGVALVVLAAGLGVVAYRPAPGASSPSASSLRGRVDALYAEHAEPPPPVECQEMDPRALGVLVEIGPKLLERIPADKRVGEALAALAALRAQGAHWSPEGWFHVARASLLAGNPDAEAMNKALLCTSFAAAENLAARVSVAHGNVKEAVEHLTRAAELNPRFWQPRYNLGLIYSRVPRMDQAVLWLKRAAESAPEIADIHFALGNAHAARAKESQAANREAQALEEQKHARAAWCRAKELGHAEATGLCPP